jgi:AraC-like DNA-binding protein
MRRDQASTRKCWRVRSASELVMFHGCHDRAFISHAHDVVTAILVTDGAVRIEVDGTGHRVGAGQLVVIGAHQVHAARPIDAGGWEMRSLHLPAALLAAQGGPPVRFARPVASIGRAASRFRALHAESEFADRDDEQASFFQALVDWFLDYADDFQPRAPWHGPVDVRLERAWHILAGSLFRNVMLDRVAEEVGLSTSSLIRHFRSRYGLPPHAWRMQARANVAAGRLRGNLPLADVADSCGFADQAHFTRVFKSVYGVTPGQYVDRH